MKLASSFEYLKPYKSDLIRVGPQGDCGYVIPRSVAENTNAMYSIGISTDWEFEVEMAARNPRIKISNREKTDVTASIVDQLGNSITDSRLEKRASALRSRKKPSAFSKIISRLIL